MPQMAPLMWLILFTMFSGLMLLSMIKIYFSKMKINTDQQNSSQKEYNSIIKSSFMNWKW